MTEKPNGVCKWCSKEIIQYGVAWISKAWTAGSTRFCDFGRVHEPVAEPAEPSASPRMDKFGRCLDCGLKDYHQDVNGKPCPYAAPQPVAGEGPQECNSETGMTVGLIDSIMGIANALTSRELNDEAAKEALLDLKSNVALKQLLYSATEGTLEEFTKELNEIADDIYMHGNYSERLRIIAKSLRPFITPACSPTNDKRVEDTFDKLAYQGFFEDVKDWPPSSRNECMEILRELATPVSTGEANGWVSVEDGLPKTTGVYGIYPPEQIDKDQGLNFSPRYFVANENRNTYVGNRLAYGWVKAKNHIVTHWRELPPAPTSVPQAEPKGEQ